MIKYKTITEAFSDMKNMKEEEAEKLSELLKYYENITKLISNENAKPLKIMNLCPPGSILEDFVNIFYERTNLPLANIYYSLLSVISSLIVKADVKIFLSEKDKKGISANVWFLLLAKSGAGKTLSLDWLRDVCEEGLREGAENLFNQASYRSRAALIQDYFENPELKNSLMIEDEFGQTLKLMNTKQEDLRDMFLQMYSGKIQGTTKRDGRQEIKNINTSVLAMTSLSSFANVTGVEDYLDGLMQRFFSVIVNQSDRGNIGNFPYFFEEQDNAIMTKDISNIEKKINSIEKFVMSEDAMMLWKEYYIKYFDEENESFYNRHMFLASKFSAIFCTISEGRENKGLILKEDMGYALRVVTQGMESIKTIMNDYLSYDKFDNLVNRVKRYIEEYQSKTTREYLQGLKVSKDQFILVLNVLKDRGNEQAKKVLLSISKKGGR